jgi:hypothetical protein
MAEKKTTQAQKHQRVTRLLMKTTMDSEGNGRESEGKERKESHMSTCDNGVIQIDSEREGREVLVRSTACRW